MAGCRMITEEEVKRVLKAADPSMKLFVLIGLTYGTRVSEALNMTFGDIDSEWVKIKGLKGGKTQNYPVTEQIHNLCTELKGDAPSDCPLFSSKKTRKVMSRQNISQKLKSLLKKVGIEGKVNSHSFRKAFVTKIYEKTGKDLAQTRIYSRHTSLTSLQYYIETSADTGLVNDLSWG